MDKSDWARFVKAMDPLRVLRPSEIEALYAERPQPIWPRLWDDLSYNPDPQKLKFLIAGSRGSGKTTELVRLQHQAADTFVAVRIDIAPIHKDGAGTLPILAALAASLELANRAWRGQDGSAGASGDGIKAALQSLGVSLDAFERLLTPLAGLMALVPEPTVQSAAAAMLVTSQGAGLTRKALVQLQDLSRGDKLQGPVTAANEQDAAVLLDALNDALVELRELSGRPPILLIDGLDKKTNLEDVYTALADVHLLTDIRAPLVFTGPAHLRTDERFAASNVVGFRAEILHNVTVLGHDADGEVVANPSGIEAMASLARRRLRDADLPESLLDADTLGELARMSSGYVRDFLRLISEAGKATRQRGADGIQREDADSAVRVVRHGLQGSLDEDDLRLLERVLRTCNLPAGERADDLFFENHIACFRNDDLWYRPHEVLVEFVRSSQA